MVDSILYFDVPKKNVFQSNAKANLIFMELNIFLSPEHWLVSIKKINIYIVINDGVDKFNRICSDFLKVWLTSMWEIK